MRNPVRTEAEAFSFVIAVLALFVAVALVGIFLNGWAALVAFVVLAPIIGYRYFRSDPKVVEPAIWDRSRDADGRQVSHWVNVEVNPDTRGNEPIDRWALLAGRRAAPDRRGDTPVTARASRSPSPRLATGAGAAGWLDRPRSRPLYGTTVS